MTDKVLGGFTMWARQTLENEIFYKKPAEWFKIWFYIINKVNHTENKQFKKGQGFFKYEWIAESCAVSKTQIDHCIRWLKVATQIATQKATRGLVITVLNYDTYQSLQTYKSDTKSDTKSETEAKQKRNRSDTINKNDKNNKDIITSNNICSWIKNFEIYRENTKQKFMALEQDKEYIAKLQTFFPNYNIITSIRKGYNGYWGKEAGWRNKIKAAKKAIKEHGSYVIDWKTTLLNNLEMSRVFYTKEELKLQMQ